jgi:Tfp pilus tip-associated adhesin PilY1
MQEDAMSKTLRNLALALAAVSAFAAGSARAQDDTALFSTAVAPNVMLLIDSSGSMNEVMWHPSFVRSHATACPIFNFIAPNSGAPPGSAGGGTMNNLSYYCDPEFASCRFTLDNGTTGFTATTTHSCPSGGTRQSGYVTRTFCGRTRRMYVDGAALCDGNATRYSEEYVEWYFSSNADAHFLGTETNTSTDVTKVDANRNGTHYIDGTQFPLYKRSRIIAAREIARDVIYQINSNCVQGGGFPCPAGSQDRVRFGVAAFDENTDAPGGWVRAGVDNYSTNATTLNTAISAIEGNAWTPLAESLFKVYTYFMSRTDADRPFGVNGSTRFPKYQYRASDGANTASPPGDPLKCPPSNTPCSCQKNFVILITDGAPTQDNFAITGGGNSNTTGRTVGFSDFVPRLVGDFNADGEVEQPAGSSGWLYLDDLAKFMATRDFRPDLTGSQTIDVYTVGFATGGDPVANALLQKTAQVGNGLFFTGTQAQELTDALVNSIQSIILKSQSFTAATVPATRTSFGGKFYNSLFVPADDSGYWEGHLQSWTITEAGEILDDGGNCAFNGNPVPCLEGSFNPVATPHWDAADTVPAPGSRNLYTSRVVSGTPTRVDFTQANISDTDLTLAIGDPALYTYTPPATVSTSLAQLADVIVENVRGCKFGTGQGSVTCAPRTDRAGATHLLGDIFHSNPVVVGRPQGFLSEPSYSQWANASTNPAVGLRDQVIVAGANDGLFRIFDAGSWDPAPPSPQPPGYTDGTGAERAGFMPYTARQNAKYLARDAGTRDWYFADGSPVVADVWLYSNPTASGPADKLMSEWRTVTIAGMRQGGNQYFALDITDPDASGYPVYMWEFPRENAAAAVKQWFGQTWSEPIITKVRLAVDGDTANPQERWVAIVGGGYSPTGDPNHSGYSIHATAGRSITMLDIKTGAIVAQKTFVDTPTATDPAAVVYDPANPQRSMLYAIPSTPGVYDIDFDGFADAIYVGDLGGNVWKWVISDVGHDPINSASTSTAQPAWHFEKFFSTPPYPAPPAAGPRHYRSFFFAPSATLKSGTLWLAFGSGERANLNYAGVTNTPPVDENNRFYAVKDMDPFADAVPSPQVPMAESSLLDITGDSSCADVGSNNGFFFRGADGEKFVTATDIFFYYVFVASFKPGVSSNPCLTGGNATLYAFKVYCGEGLFDDGSGNPVATIDLGDGMPTDPKVSLSGADGGSRVFINKKDEVLSKDTGFNLDDATGQAYWRELHE